MRSSGGLHAQEGVDEAAWQATRGAAVGAAKWGAATAFLGGIGYAVSPIYRGLTIQFKVFIQMSGMVVGSMIEADRRLREYEARVRLQRKMAIDRATWEKYEKLYDEPLPPVKGEKR